MQPRQPNSRISLHDALCCAIGRLFSEAAATRCDAAHATGHHVIAASCLCWPVTAVT